MNDLNLESDPEDQTLLHIIWKGERIRTVIKPLFMKHLNFINKCQNKEDFLTQFKALEIRIAKAEGRRLLARKGYFSEELSQRLRFKRLSEEVIDLTIQYLEEKEWIQDRDRLEAMARRELKKGHGLRYILRMLANKTKRPEEIAELKPLIEEGEKESLQAYLNKKSATKYQGDFQKLQAHLLSRGYSYEAVKEALDRDAQMT